MILSGQKTYKEFHECFNFDKKFIRPDEFNQDKDDVRKQVNGFEKYMEKVNKFAHHYLYCRDPNQMLTVSENKVLINQRHKYLQYIAKNYKYKLPEEFTSKKVMKQKRLELLKRVKEFRLKKQLQQQEIKAKKRKRPNKQKQKDEEPPRKKKIKGETQKKDLGNKEEKDKIGKQKQKANKEVVENNNKNMQEQNEQMIEQQEVERVSDGNFESEQDLRNKDLDNIEQQDGEQQNL